jgi:acetyl-CoA acetyltransferase
MREAWIPYGAWWCSPFARWQGSLSGFHALELAAHTAKAALAARGIDPAGLTSGVLGTTVPQRQSFYGFPWLAGMLGAGHLAGPTIAQACATSARLLAYARGEVAEGAKSVLVIAADRVSNGPHLYYPDPGGPGGTGVAENWVMDNFGLDPHGGTSMIQTGENVAGLHNIGTQQQHDLVLQRYHQYEAALADDSAFLRRFMALPFALPGRRPPPPLTGDEGVHPSTAEGMARLRPVLPGGTITYAGQTHPADGNAGLIVTSQATARELASEKIGVRIAGIGQARVGKAMMPLAPIPAARAAMAQAGIGVADLAAVKTHNPFIINDIVLLRETGIPAGILNNSGCSLIWGHPQGPTGLRCLIELAEELVLRGGGWGLFTGCAAGDSGMAVVIRVGDA